MFTFVSNFLAVMLPISSGLSFSPLYDTNQLEYFGVSVLVITDFLKVTSYVDTVSPIQKFGSLKIFA